ncbi:MAG: hypothetical protein AAF995_03590 [Planctomycetota bacterium]
MNKQSFNAVLPRCVMTALAPSLAILGSHVVAAEPGRAVAASRPAPESLPIAPEILLQHDQVGQIGARDRSMPEGVFLTVRNASPLEIDEPTSIRPAGGPSLPPLTLSSVLPSGARSVAVIEGRPVRVGDTVAPGWRVVAIDGRTRSVVLEYSTGERARISMATGQD